MNIKFFIPLIILILLSVIFFGLSKQSQAPTDSSSSQKTTAEVGGILPTGNVDDLFAAADQETQLDEDPVIDPSALQADASVDVFANTITAP